MEWMREREEVLRASLEILRKGLVVGMSGNISMRVGDDLIAITPSQRYYEELRPEDIVLINFDGEPVEEGPIPSIESMMHILIYKERRDVKAVVHTHSLFASVLSVACLPVPPILDEQTLILGGEIEIVEYSPPGSEELAKRVASVMREKNGVILQNHGAVAVGRGMREAIIAAELLERISQIYVLSKLLGKITTIPEEVLKFEKEIFRMRREEA